MSSDTASDVYVSPGVTGTGLQDVITTGVQVYPLVQNVPSGSLWIPQFWVPIVGGEFPDDSCWVSMMSSAEWFIIWDIMDNVPPDPSPLATPALNPTQQCIRVPGNFEYMRKVVRGNRFKLIQIASVSDIMVRLEVVQPIFYG